MIRHSVQWILFIVILFMLSACGTPEKETEITLSGQVTFGNLSPSDMGPVFVAVLNQNPMETTGFSMQNSLVAIKTITKDDPRFSLTLSSRLVRPGDTVFLIAFADNDFQNGTPAPGPGDILGYYVDPAKMVPDYVLQAGENSGLVISVTKEVFDYEASLSGTVSSEANGELTLFAYAGDIASLDLTSEIDPDQVIAFQKITKINPSETFELKILPYGNDLPITNVFVFAWLDTDESGGLPNAGDLIGFVSGDNGLPARLTVDGTDPGDLEITLSMAVPFPSQTQVLLSGQVDVPDDMDVGDAPICILVVRAGESLDFSTLIQGSFSDLVWYEKLDPGMRTFACDLSNQGLSPGDKVMVLAVCDLSLTAGFPDLSPGDYLGFYQDKALMDVSLTLAAGENRVETIGDKSFSMTRVMYEHSAQVLFELEDDRLQAMALPESLDPGETVTVAVIAQDGVEISVEGSAIDMDYAIGFGTVTVPETGNDGYSYSLDILPFIDRRIMVQDPFSLANVYVFAIFDGNTSGDADANNYIGYYWRTIFFSTMVPDLVGQIVDGPNVLDKTIRFTPDTL